MKKVISVTEGQYRNQVVQYDPSTILELCHRLSLKLLREKKNIIGGTWPYGRGGVFHITQHKLALLAMITLQNHKYAHGRKPSNKEFIALVNNVSTINPPTKKTKPSDRTEAISSIMVPVAYQQFPFQENSYNVMPRHLLIYLYSKVQSPALNIDNVAYQNFGLHIREYLTIGIAFYGASLAHSMFDRSFMENTPVEGIKKYLTTEKVEKFLARTSADFNTFRERCMQEIHDYPDGGTYRFNTLFDRPIIIRKDGRFCIPVPMLVPYVITKGLYYDFLDLFSAEPGNLFADWFGHALEYYGGLLLKKALGKQSVFPEPVYGKEEKRGPDWTVIQGNSAIVFEFRSGRLNKKAKIYGNYTDISALVKRNIIEPLKKLPGKIEDIKSGLTDIPSNGDMEFFPCIVTYEPLYPNQLFREICSHEMKNENIPEYDFELLSIEDLEWLMSWAPYESPADFLKAKRGNQEWKYMEIRQLIGIKMKERGLKGLRNVMLDNVSKKFWQEFIPESSQEF